MKAYLGGEFDVNRETGGRKFYNGAVIDRIQKAGSRGWFDIDPYALTVPHPRFDKPPFPVCDMLVLDRAAIVGHENADMSLKIGERTFSGSSIVGEGSLGALQLDVHEALAIASYLCDFLFGIGEGGCAPSIRGHPNLMVQMATGLFGIDAELLRFAAAISHKMGQAAKDGMGGFLPWWKVKELMQMIRGMPGGVDIASDAAFIKSVEEMYARILVTHIIAPKTPVFIKIGVTHDFVHIGAAAARAGAAGIIVDCFGGTGAAPNVHRDHTGMDPILAIARLHLALEALGLRDGLTGDFKIIPAGRIDSPETAFKLNLVGADADLLMSYMLIAMGCKMVNMCDEDCFTGLAAVPDLPDGSPKRKLEIEKFAAPAAVKAYTAFNRGKAQLLGAYGFSSPRNARGHFEILSGSDMPPSLAKLLNIPNKGSRIVVPLDFPQQYFRDIANELAKTAKVPISAMGKTTDLDAPYSDLDWLNHPGRIVVGPPYDSHRDDIELLLRLPGRVNIGLPLILEDSSPDMAALARERNTIVFSPEGDADPKRRIIAIDASDQRVLEEQVFRIRASSGVLLTGDEANEENIRRIKILSPQTPVYVSIAGTESVRDDVIGLAKMGFDGIIIQGSLSMKDPTPIDVTISQAHDALSKTLYKGNILRRKVVLLARTDIRISRDIYALNCLGANGVITDVSTMIDTPTFKRRLDLLTGLGKELRGNMGASGLSMMASIIGNRELLRANHYMSDERAALLGVKKDGE